MSNNGPQPAAALTLYLKSSRSVLAAGGDYQRCDPSPQGHEFLCRLDDLAAGQSTVLTLPVVIAIGRGTSDTYVIEARVGDRAYPQLTVTGT